MAASNLATRFATAAVGGPVILGILYFGEPWWFFAFLNIAAVIGATELFAMTHPEDKPAQGAGVVVSLAVMHVLWWRGHDPASLIVLLLAVPLLGQLLVLWRLGDVPTAATRVMANTFGPLYLGGGLAALAMLRRDAGADGPGFVLLALMLSWLSDTGAYFAGRFLGKHKLYPAVSPKKTVEGALGGLAGGAAGALLGSYLYLTSMPVLDGLILAIVAGGLGQAGDLGESLLKRSTGVKDSGGIVPGHGGILDRTDALLVTGAFCYGYVIWFRG